ncbi:hypothetical protein K458DRAFT_39873 [Lentithecium fluviatile CBS 122367]|uniref:Uncharacterized protein n=1 Tax=Lentithecium fluviatile CBS 122367 TaxID=1168545 RepID=A0A6G1IZD7_9PLEO|nr:hypothetical protein K458DRAFT_39873 [Lentithecium fluviatile CBS 122367]
MSIPDSTRSYQLTVLLLWSWWWELRYVIEEGSDSARTALAILQQFTHAEFITRLTSSAPTSMMQIQIRISLPRYRLLADRPGSDGSACRSSSCSFLTGPSAQLDPKPSGNYPDAHQTLTNHSHSILANWVRHIPTDSIHGVSYRAYVGFNRGKMGPGIGANIRPKCNLTNPIYPLGRLHANGAAHTYLIV